MFDQNNLKKIYVTLVIATLILSVASVVLAQEVPKEYRTIEGMGKWFTDNLSFNNIFGEEPNDFPGILLLVELLTTLPAAAVVVVGTILAVKYVKEYFSEKDYFSSESPELIEIIIGAITWIASIIVLAVILGKYLFWILLLAGLFVLYILGRYKSQNNRYGRYY